MLVIRVISFDKEIKEGYVFVLIEYIVEINIYYVFDLGKFYWLIDENML